MLKNDWLFSVLISGNSIYLSKLRFKHASLTLA